MSLLHRSELCSSRCWCSSASYCSFCRCFCLSHLLSFIANTESGLYCKIFIRSALHSCTARSKADILNVTIVFKYFLHKFREELYYTENTKLKYQLNLSMTFNFQFPQNSQSTLIMNISLSKGMYNNWPIVAVVSVCYGLHMAIKQFGREKGVWNILHDFLGCNFASGLHTLKTIKKLKTTQSSKNLKTVVKNLGIFSPRCVLFVQNNAQTEITLDVVEPFSLDPDFDYDNVQLSAKFTDEDLSCWLFHTVIFRNSFFFVRFVILSAEQFF